MVGAVVAENRTPRGRVRRWESRPRGRPKSGQQGRRGHRRARADLSCLFAYLFAYLGAQATTTLTATPCREGRNVARASSSKTKVPPGLMACVLRIRSLASHATVQAWRHSPSTK